MAKAKGTEAELMEYDKTKPNESLDLSGFDYGNLKADSFKAYEEFINSLELNKAYDFQLFKVTPLFTERYPGIQGSPKDFTGIVIKNLVPENTTRITVKNALNYNAQIFNDHGRTNGKYYLLKK